MLPPLRKLFNPIELLFGDTKAMTDKILWKKYKFGFPSKLTSSQLEGAWHTAEKELTLDHFLRAFRERANGKKFFEMAKQKGFK